MSFEFVKAVRQNVRLVIGLAGSTGSGKTYSALRLAKGLSGGERFCLIDTENGRALHYADEFDFDHGALEPPFTPARYTEAIQAADAKGYPVIVVDSASHEHAGDGGLLDMHEAVLTRMAGDDWRKREQATFAAWVEPKHEHKKFVAKLLNVNAHLILCLRAEEKIELARNEQGKLEVRPKRSLSGLDGWIPVCERNLPYELTLSLLFTADRPGVPKPIKLQAQHRLIVPLGEPVGEQTGGSLGAWAEGVVSEQEQRIGDLTGRLLGCADALGKRDDVTDSIQKNRSFVRGDLGEHAKWLQAQLANAEAAVARQKPSDVDWGAEPDAA